MATAPGKLILTGEYAVLDGAPALVVAVDRRVTATHTPATARGSSPFLTAVMDELAKDHPAAARLVPEISVDSSAFYQDGQKLGLGSSAAVTVATTALALGAWDHQQIDDSRRHDIFRRAFAAHANCQGTRGARGSGADIAAAVYGGALVFELCPPDRPAPSADDVALLGGDSTVARRSPGTQPDRVSDPSATPASASARGDARPSRRIYFPPPQRSIAISHRQWPTSVRLLPFFIGRSADTASLVAQVAAARTARPDDVDAALAAIAAASKAVCDLIGSRVIQRDRSATDHDATLIIGGFKLAAASIDRLARATGVDLVPDCVTRAAAGLAQLGGTAKTTGAGGGDIGIAVIPATADETVAMRILIETGCQPLPLSVDDTGVDTREAAK